MPFCMPDRVSSIALRAAVGFSRGSPWEMTGVFLYLHKWRVVGSAISQHNKEQLQVRYIY